MLQTIKSMQWRTLVSPETLWCDYAFGSLRSVV